MNLSLPIYSLYKMNPAVKPMSGALVTLPSPSFIKYAWSMGSLLGLCLSIQLLTGVFLAMHYCSDSALAFESVKHTAWNINLGWFIQMAHANGASLFFVCLYFHIARGMYFNAYRLQITWNVGVILLLLVMATAFLGYVLPWGQMSFWGASVITSLFSSIPFLGPEMVSWVWGGSAVDSPTLTRFFALHFLVPFLVSAFALIHLISLHQSGSSNPLGASMSLDKVSLYPQFIMKDVLGFFASLSFLLVLISYSPWLLGDPENFIPANPLVTPTHIQPEWYFLFAYAILRSIPSKLGGVVALALSVMVLTLLPLMSKAKLAHLKFYPLSMGVFWLWVSSIFLLTWIGAHAVEDPYIVTGQILTMAYFYLFMVFPTSFFVWDRTFKVPPEFPHY